MFDRLTNYVPTAANTATYAEIVAEKAVRRRLIQAVAKLPGLVMTNQIPHRHFWKRRRSRTFRVS